jgi:hypothetical protein
MRTLGRHYAAPRQPFRRIAVKLLCNRDTIWFLLVAVSATDILGPPSHRRFGNLTRSGLNHLGSARFALDIGRRQYGSDGSAGLIINN